MAANRIKGITIKIDGDVTGLNKALESTNKSLRTTQSHLRDVDKLLKMDPKNVELLRQKQDLLTKSVEDTKKKLETEKEALRQLKEADQTPEVKEQQDALQREIAETEQQLKKAEDQLKDFGSVGKQQMKVVSDQVKDVGNHMKDLGANITKHVTTAIVGIGTAAIAAFNEVDKGYDAIVKKTGATGEALEGMKDILDDIVTTIPTDFETAGNAIGEVNTRFGLTGDELEDLSGRFIKFADLNDTDVSDSIDKVQKALAAYGLGAEDAEGFLDRLNKVGQDTGVSVDKLSEGIVANSASFKELGLGIDEAVVFMGALEKSGVSMDTVLTGIRKAMKKATDEGISLNEALAWMQNEIKNGTFEMDGLSAAYEYFGTKSGAQVHDAIVTGSLDLQDFNLQLDDVSGNIEDSFAETQDPIDDFKMALNGVKLTGAELGATLLTTLNPIIQKLGEYARMLKEKWESLSPDTQDMIIKAALIAAAIGPVITTVGILVTAIGALISPIGLVIAAIAGAIAIGVLLYQNWDTIVAAAQAFKDNLINDFNILKDGVVGIFTGIKDFFTDTWENIKNKTHETWDNIKNKVEENGGGIQGIIKTAVDAYQDLWKKGFEKLDEITGGKLTDIYNWFHDKFTAIKDFVSDIVDSIKGLFDFEWSLPNIKLPHISWDWVEVGILGSIPTFSVEWYKKAYNNPYLFTSPTIVGGRGFGDGGGSGEIVYGRDQLLKDISLAAGATYNLNIYASEGMDVNELADRVQDRLVQLQKQEEAVYA